MASVTEVSRACLVLIGLTITSTEAHATDVSLQATRNAACAIVNVWSAVDLIPDGASGVAIRITSPNTKEVARRLTVLWPTGPPAGISGVVIEQPRPKLAIVLDDFGLHKDQLARVWGLAEPLTYAILPGQLYSNRYARWLQARGASTLAHVPMEPEDSSHMTLDGFLTADMTTKQQALLFRRHVEAIPGAVGWNNHMGSRLTSDPKAMRALVAATPNHEIILDSRTTPGTVLESLARRVGHRVARRHVFIDNERQERAIFGQLLKAMELAVAEGQAVAIGHAYPETARAIRRFTNDHASAVQLVPIERVVKPTTRPGWVRHCQPAQLP